MNPADNNWNNAANWTPAQVPTGTASFGLSNVTDLSISTPTSIGKLVFTTGADSYTITTIPTTNNPFLTFMVTGAGITNNSGVAQTFVVATDEAGDGSSIQFANTAAPGAMTNFISQAAAAKDGANAYVYFTQSASAGSASFYNTGCAIEDGIGGEMSFGNKSSADLATITNAGGSGSGALGGETYFGNSSTAAHATTTCIGGTVTGAKGGSVYFSEGSWPDSATLTVNGGTEGAEGGEISFLDFENGNRPSTARAVMSGNATLFVSRSALGGRQSRLGRG
jgi:hypothetical protein